MIIKNIVSGLSESHKNYLGNFIRGPKKHHIIIYFFILLIYYTFFKVRQFGIVLYSKG